MAAAARTPMRSPISFRLRASRPDDRRALVSVAIRAYRERWLGEAIESVLSQTHSDLELVVLDDRGGLDAVVAEYADPRIRYHRAAAKRGASGRFAAAFELTRGPLRRPARRRPIDTSPGFVAALARELQRRPGAGVAFSQAAYQVGGRRIQQRDDLGRRRPAGRSPRRSSSHSDLHPALRRPLSARLPGRTPCVAMCLPDDVAPDTILHVGAEPPPAGITFSSTTPLVISPLAPRADLQVRAADGPHDGPHLDLARRSPSRARARPAGGRSHASGSASPPISSRPPRRRPRAISSPPRAGRRTWRLRSSLGPLLQAWPRPSRALGAPPRPRRHLDARAPRGTSRAAAGVSLRRATAPRCRPPGAPPADRRDANICTRCAADARPTSERPRAVGRPASVTRLRSGGAGSGRTSAETHAPPDRPFQRARRTSRRGEDRRARA